MPARAPTLANMSLKQRIPLLRWSVWRFAWGMPGFFKTGQIGDGREQACADFVEANARRGDIDDVLAAIDKFAYEKSMLMNVGDEKGALLDAAVRRADPNLVLELGTYCGYGSLRLARAAPTAKVYSVEFSAANAEVARRIWAHAGVDNVRFPGAPKYRAYMTEQQGKLFNTVEHKAHVEYQTMIPDLVLESEYLGG